MAVSVFSRLIDQYEWAIGMGGGGRLCVPVERMEKVCRVLEFEMNEPLFDLVQAVTRWYERVHRPQPKESEEGGLQNAAWVN